MPGRLEFSLDFDQSGQMPQRRHGADEPRRILILADLGGRDGCDVAGLAPIAERTPKRVDIDSFDDLLRRTAPKLSVCVPGGGGDADGVETLEIEIGELDDFRPEALYDKLDIFRTLRDLRRRLLDPATYDEAARFLKQGAQDSKGDSGDTPTDTSAAASGGSEFEQLLGGAPAEANHAKQTARSAIDSLVAAVVAPHVEKATDPQQAQLLSAVDDSIGAQMRAVLHDPGFQSVETVWRSVHELITSVETGEELQVFLLDVSRSELLADFSAAGADLETSQLYRLLVEKGLGTPGGLTWTLLVSNLYFGAGDEDLALLAGMGAIAARAGAPYLAAAAPELLGCPAVNAVPDPRDWQPDGDIAEDWAKLRAAPIAEWIGLTFPRVLARLPYGDETDEIEGFDFEEVASAKDHDQFLWGSAALGCARLMAETWAEAEALCEPGSHLELSDLPAFTYFDGDGQRQLLPCAEALLSERAGEAILAEGIMPVMSYRDRNSARILRFQSIADPLAALRGPWT